ncbi:hypothetical protein SAMN04489842_3876 [Natronobacterium texcoconense]|uniref:Uncharacterized protein n=1 Tax=Natronobacterium texcoconense TaxID=1095778 RepID=A0A1H1IX24_NATTX|nr:hypothetical protein SAMN04489842_3876 [Natronobacterium texcoconense]
MFYETYRTQTNHENKTDEHNENVWFWHPRAHRIMINS